MRLLAALTSLRLDQGEHAGSAESIVNACGNASAGEYRSPEALLYLDYLLTISPCMLFTVFAPATSIARFS